MESEDVEGKILEVGVTSDAASKGESSSLENCSDDDVQITCFTEDLHDVTLHFQIIRLQKQVFVWVGCNSAKFGNLYAASTTRPENMVSVASLLGGTADNTGSSMARRVALKTGLSIVLACNIPKDSPMLEATAERRLMEKMRSLGYIKAKSPRPAELSNVIL